MKFSIAVAVLTAAAVSTTKKETVDGATSSSSSRLPDFIAVADYKSSVSRSTEKSIVSKGHDRRVQKRQQKSDWQRRQEHLRQRKDELDEQHNRWQQQQHRQARGRQRRRDAKERSELASSGRKKQTRRLKNGRLNTSEKWRRTRRNMLETNEEHVMQHRQPRQQLRLKNPAIVCDPTGRTVDGAWRSYDSDPRSANENVAGASAGAGHSPDPDVGILSCGFGLYCRPDPTSELGGFCVPIWKKSADRDGDDGDDDDDDDDDKTEKSSTDHDHDDKYVDADVGILKASQPHNPGKKVGGFDFDPRRRMDEESVDAYFAYLNETYCNNINFTCSSCAFDVETYTVNIDCLLDEPCDVLEDVYCGTGSTSEICYESQLVRSFDYATDNQTVCYGIKTTLDKVDLVYCVSYFYNEIDGTTCQVTINDDECTSCEFVMGLGSAEDSIVFDCTNTVLNRSGNVTEDGSVLAGFLDYDILYYFLPCSDGCNACGLGKAMLELGGVLDLPSGDQTSCDDFQLAYLTGELGPGSDDCDDFVPTRQVYETCQCYGVNVAPMTPPEFSATFSPTTAPTVTPELTIIDYLNGVCTTYSTLFDCASCVVDSESFTANVTCKSRESCKDIPGRCSSPVNMCSRQDVIATVRSMEEYTSTVCYETKTGDFDYQFSYCVTYEKSPPSCKMSVEGIECTSCSVADDGDDKCYLFDCTNTLIGYAGSTCTADLTSKLESYFLYKLLPCDDGCSLCEDDETMTDGSKSFTYNNQEFNCFEAQLASLVGPTDDSFCSGASSVAAEVCGCKDTTVSSSIATPSILFPFINGHVSVLSTLVVATGFAAVAAAFGVDTFTL